MNQPKPVDRYAELSQFLGYRMWQLDTSFDAGDRPWQLPRTHATLAPHPEKCADDDQAREQNDDPAGCPHLFHAARSTATSRTAATSRASSTVLPTMIPPVSSSRFQVRS